MRYVDDDGVADGGEVPDDVLPEWGGDRVTTSRAPKTRRLLRRSGRRPAHLVGRVDDHAGLLGGGAGGPAGCAGGDADHHNDQREHDNEDDDIAD